MLRRLHPDQPDSFAFTPANLAWAKAQITKFPEGRQASAVIPLLWRAQEQEGWLSRPAMEHVAAMLDLAYIRVLEVATFYFMFQLHPVGSIANIQVCGTTSCMICGAEDLIAVCKEKIAPSAHTLSADGKFTWEEVECLGACANAPMAQIGKDYYEDLTAERFGEIIDELSAGKVPVPGPQNGRYAAEPASGLTSLTQYEAGKAPANASVQLATDIGDTVKRIDGTEVPLLTPWRDAEGTISPAEERAAAESAKMDASPVDDTPSAPVAPPEPVRAAPEPTPVAPPTPAAAPVAAPVAPTPDPVPVASPPAPAGAGRKPEGLSEPRGGKADDLKLVKGIGPKLEKLCNTLGFWHFDQIAQWTPEEVAWVDDNLQGFKGRVTRDEWIEQAKVLAAGGTTAFSKRVDDGNVY